MKKTRLFASIAITSVGFLGIYGHNARGQGETAVDRQITLKFHAIVADRPFKCGESYSLGTPTSTVTANDFRFYLSEIALINDRGEAVPLTLQQDGKWQYQNVALLDFENKSGACANGTEEMRDRIVGTIPQGKYQGLQFTLGVPFDLNHQDATLAPSPLNLTSLWWNWRGGYKFMRIDFTQKTAQSPSVPIDRHHKQHHHHQNQGFLIHLGSTGCEASNDNQKPSNCRNPNQAKIVLDNFDPQNNLITVDLNALLSNTNLQANQPDTPPGCMSDPEDRDCLGIMNSLGLPFANESAGKQTFFQVK